MDLFRHFSFLDPVGSIIGSPFSETNRSPLQLLFVYLTPSESHLFTHLLLKVLSTDHVRELRMEQRYQLLLLASMKNI